MGTDVEHQKRVAEQFPSGSIEWLVALYHDHIEDKIGGCKAELSSSRVCEYGTKGCVIEHMPPAVYPHVEVLTRRSDEAYNDYIARVRGSGDPVAIAVKIADAKDNLNRCTGRYGGHVNSNRANRYRYVLKELGVRSDTADTMASHGPEPADLGQAEETEPARKDDPRVPRQAG